MKMVNGMPDTPIREIYCKRCGTLIGDSGHESRYTLNPRKYCLTCAHLRRIEKQKRYNYLYRQKQKKEAAETKTQLELIRQKNQLLQEEIKLLEARNRRLRGDRKWP